MELVVDANILLAGVLKNALTRELLLDSRIRLCAPEHLILETLHLLKTNSRLQKRVGLPFRILQENFYLLTHEIETYPKKSYVPFLEPAIKIAPHREDAPYLALALLLRVPIWSNDKGLQSQNQVMVLTTQQVVDLLSQR